MTQWSCAICWLSRPSSRRCDRAGHRAIISWPARPAWTGRWHDICARWGPSHASLLDDRPNAESLNFHPLTDDWYVLSRTVYGGPEYSGRGGLQVFTHFLLLRGEQLPGYENNPVVVARTARLLGALRLLLNIPSHLPSLELPDRPLKGCAAQQPPRIFLREEIIRSLRFPNRVAVIGVRDPLPVLTQIVRDLPSEERRKLSFTTGLKPSVHRDFRLHFLGDVDAAIHAQLSQQDIELVSATNRPAPAACEPAASALSQLRMGSAENEKGPGSRSALHPSGRSGC